MPKKPLISGMRFPPNSLRHERDSSGAVSFASPSYSVRGRLLKCGRDRRNLFCRDKIRAVETSTLYGVYEIRAIGDVDAGGWVAESDDVRGLVAEADSPKVLVQKLRTLIPELLELNGAVRDRTASFHVLYQHEDSGVLTF